MKGQGILDRKVSLDVENTTIKSVLTEIENQTSVVFTYRSRLIKASKKVSFKMSDARLSEVLTELFGQEVAFLPVHEEEEIILKPVPSIMVAGPVTDVNELLAITVSGTVTDGAGQPLPGVNVVENVKTGLVDGIPYLEIYKGTDYENPVFDESRHYLWPIPLSDISQNPNLGQNPGW